MKSIHMLLATILAGVFGLTAAIAWAETTSYRDPQGYAYYDIWWEEHRSDEETALLLHFGQPAEHPWTRIGNARIAANKKDKPPSPALAEDLGGDMDMGGLGDLMDDIGAKHAEDRKQRHGRFRTDKAPAGVVYDYSPNRKEVKLPAGVRKVEDGRFGPGLKLTGQNGLVISIGDAGGRYSMEGWFKPAKLPEKGPVALLASPADGARLLLHPDGTVEFTCVPGPGADRISLRSEQALKPGQWHHLAGYTWVRKHIEGGRGRSYQQRLGIDGNVAASWDGRESRRPALVHVGPFHVGENPKGGQVFTGLVDDVRVAGLRRYNVRAPMDWRDPDGQAEVPFGRPHFKTDARVFHASFEDRSMTVAAEKDAKVKWDLPEGVEFSDFQVPGPHGQALLVDPAMGFPRIPIQGLSPKRGSFELWLRPVNWDNHTDFGKINWAAHTMSVIRFMGRDKRTGKVVQFMELNLARATIHGEATWLHPGQWSHLVWSWSPEMVVGPHGWGGVDPNTPQGTFRAHRFGELFYRGQLKRDIRLIDRIEPLYAEIGIADEITTYHGQRPAIAVDEVIGHGYDFSEDEKKRAPKRWTGGLEKAPPPAND